MKRKSLMEKLKAQEDLIERRVWDWSLDVRISDAGWCWLCEELNDSVDEQLVSLVPEIIIGRHELPI